MDFSKIIVPKIKTSFDASKVTLSQPKSSFDISKISMPKIGVYVSTSISAPTRSKTEEIAVARGKAMEDFYTKQYTNFMNELGSAVKWYNTKNYGNPNANSIDFVLKYPDYASKILGEYRFSQLPFYKRWGIEASGYFNLIKKSIQNIPEEWKKDPVKVISDTAGIIAMAYGVISLGKAVAQTIQIWKYPTPGLKEAVNDFKEVSGINPTPENLDQATQFTLNKIEKGLSAEGTKAINLDEMKKFLSSAIYLKNYQIGTNAVGGWGLTLRDLFAKSPKVLQDIIIEGEVIVSQLPQEPIENLVKSINLIRDAGNVAMNNLYPKPVTPATIFSGINLPALGSEQVIKGLIELSKTVAGNPQITKELNKSLIETKLNEIQNYAYEYADSKDPGYQMADRPSETAGYKYELEKFKELGGQTLNEIYDLYRRNLDIPNELKQRATKILNTEIPKIEPKVPENLQSIANEPESIHSKKVEQIAKDAVEKVKQSENEEEALDALNQMENEFIKMLKVAKDNTERNDLYFDMEIALKQLPREYTTIGKNILKGFDNIRHTYNLLHTEDERQKQEKIQPQQVLTTPEVPAPKTDKELISNSDLKLMERFEVPSKARNIKELKRLTELEKLGYVEQIEPGYFKETKLNSLKDNLQPPETFKPPLAPKPIDIYKKRYIQLSDEDFKGVSNGSIFEFQNPIKEEELPFVATKEIKTTGVKNTFSGYFVDNADPVIEKIAEGIGRYSGAQFSVYKSASGQIVALDRDYLQYFKKRYGNFEMYVGKDATNSPVVIKQDDKNIGLIMPIELDKDKLIPEIPSGKYLTPLGEKLGIKPQVPPAETQVFTVPQAEQTTTPSTQTIPTNVQVPEKSIGIYKGQEYPLPKGFVLKKPNLQYDGGLGRYLWMPEKNDFIYYPSLKKIYKYLEWQDKAPNGMVGLDGFAKLQDIKTKEIGWVNNIKAREGIPLKEISANKIPKGTEKANITRLLNKAKAELKKFETLIKRGEAIEGSSAHIKRLREIEYQQARLEGLSGEEALARADEKFPEIKPETPTNTQEISKEVATNIKPQGEATQPGYLDLTPLRNVYDKLKFTHPQENALQTFREVLAKVQRTKDIFMKDSLYRQRAFGRLTREQRLEFIKNVETGQPQSDPTLEKVAQYYRQILDQDHKDIESTGKPVGFIDNYFPHIWKDPTRVQQVFSSRRPLRGKAPFLKHRIIPFISDGIEAGFEPISDNPEELFAQYHLQVQKYVLLNEWWENNTDKKFVRFGDKISEGYMKVDDSIANVLQYSETEKGFIQRGFYVLPTPEANFVNNYLSPGLSRFGAFRGLMAMKNITNAIQLGFSGFHALMTGFNVGISTMSRGMMNIKQGIITNQPKIIGRGLGQIAYSVPALPYEIVRTLYIGHKISKEWFAPNSMSRDITDIVQRLEQAGGRLRMSEIFSIANNSWTEIGNELKAWHISQATINIILKTMNYVQAPLLKYYVPRMKLGVFYDEIKDWTLTHPDASEQEVKLEAVKIWDSIDNRFGELVYDNLMWNKTVKDILMLGIRALGWNIGNVRELGGGAINLVFGSDKAGSNFFAKRITRKSTYLIALFLFMGLIGYTYERLKGQKIKSLLDLYAPRTGKILPNGSEERIVFPSYVKDVVSLTKQGIWTTVKNKLNPDVSIALDIMNNADYYGTQIRDPYDPAFKQAVQIFDYILQAHLPFSLSGFQQRLKTDTSPAEALLSFLGINPAPSYISKTNIQQIITNLYIANLPKVTTKAEDEKLQARSAVRAKIFNHTATADDINDLIQKGYLKQSDVSKFISDSLLPGDIREFAGLSLDEQIKVLNLCTKEERARYLPYVHGL